MNKPQSNTHGFALLFVLGLLVLVTTILVGFLLSATTERSAAGGFAAASQARQLADTAVSLVQAQINHATTRGPGIAWVSQPGMVRTYDNSGALLNAYKLYSAPDLIHDSINIAADLPPTGEDSWEKQPALWVDLNAPITANGIKNFPILAYSENPSATDPSPNAEINNIGPVEGFRLDPTTKPSSTTYQPAPMPVRWLYILKDGSVVVPDAAQSTNRNAVIKGASKSNPITGRIAFWTDDETCKVNINTAGEGTFWDVPRGFTKTEAFEYALKQPVLGEYQRYPGHPATVSLSAVFPAANPGSAPLLEDYFKLTPFYSYGGSKGGTVAITSGSSPLATAIPRKAERLYASIDEIMFKADRTENSPLTMAAIKARSFFLTARSKAPETNLFNLPRIAVWPVHELSATDWDKRTSAFDRAIAFCSSTGAPGSPQLPYFFQRKDAYDPDYDLLQIPRNLALYSYLGKLTESVIPGFGGDFVDKYGALETEQILTQMFDYVRCANLYDDRLDRKPDGTPLPGNQWGSYTFTRNILTDVTKPNGDQRGQPGHGMAVPVHGPNGTMGQGRFHTLRQLEILLIACADGDQKPTSTPFSNDPAKNAMLNGTALLPGQMRLQAMMLPELFSTMVGRRLLHPDMTLEIEGLNTFTITDQAGVEHDLRFPNLGWISLTADAQSMAGTNLGGDMVRGYACFNKVAERSNSIPMQSGDNIYSFISAPITIRKGSTMKFSGGKVTVRFRSGKGPTGKLVQTLRLEFPSVDLPLPSLAKDPTYWSCFSDGVGGGLSSQGRSKVRNTGGNNIQNPIVTRKDDFLAPSEYTTNAATQTDVIRALVPATADYRVVAATAESQFGDLLFVPHPSYFSGGAWALMYYTDTGTGQVPGKDNGARLVAGGGMVDRNIPKDLFPTSKPAADSTGDFDIGPGKAAHGSGANKPDEGEVFRESVGSGALQGPDGYSIPYFYGWNNQRSNGQTFFSPNRIMPSPVMFGSLPTGSKSGVGWRTLLFRPTNSYETGHLTSGPRDHLFLDLFWMPVVEPYAISERFATAGKINMNYQILPFTYIERSTGMRAVLKSERMSRIPTTENNAKMNPNIYSSGYPDPGQTEYRYDVDVNKTLEQFSDRFNSSDQNKNVFISATELCDLHIVPKDPAIPSDWNSGHIWNNYRQTGDNVRERVYATIYPKLTTRSNSFTVHFRAQSLGKGKLTPADTWVEGADAVTGEYRGSTTIERFIDPNANVPDYATEIASTGTPDGLRTLDNFYKWRVIHNRQFAP